VLRIEMLTIFYPPAANVDGVLQPEPSVRRRLGGG
jgi:hypothetical protein